jgi:hypothetical protein
MIGRREIVTTGMRLLWLAVTVPSSTVIAVIAGMLTYASGQGLAGSLIAGGAAFVGTEGLLLAILGFALPGTYERL